MAREMKDSGIEWLESIPSSWSLGRIGQLYSERKQKVSDTEYAPLSVTMKGILPQLSTAAKTDAHDDRKLVCKGDFAINSRSDRRGSCGISEYDGSVSLINIVLSPRNNMNPTYYNWLFHSTMFSSEFYKWGHGIVNDLWTTGWQDMKRISIPVPSLEEQHRIADFLDHKCAEIDRVLEKSRVSIAEYKKLKQSVITQAVTKGIRGEREMKDSGIEWIGEIPKEWVVMKLSYVVQSISDVDHRMPESIEEGYPYLMTGDLADITSKIDFTKCKQISKSDFDILSQKSKPCFGDIIFARYATIGTVCFVDTLNDFLVSYSCVTIRPKAEELYGKYLYHYYKSTAFEEEAKQYVNSNTQSNIGIEALLRTKVILPNMEEQNEIANYLDRKCSEIDTLISKKEQLIIELEAYKKSLIYEYVTGKKVVI